MLYGLIPAFLKTRFGVNEILTSLMLVYIAQLFLDYLARGPGATRRAFNFPQSVTFDPSATLPPIFEAGRVHYGVRLRARRGPDHRVSSRPHAVRLSPAPDRRRAPRRALRRLQREAHDACRLRHFGRPCGACRHLEVAGQIGQLQPSISPGYGFTAITVAFLGRLNPFGILVAALVVALTFIGGESAQILLKLPLDLTQAFQGILLLCVLAADALVSNRVRIVRRGGRRMTAFEAILLTIVTASTPLLIAALGELVAERSGRAQSRVEGMMAMGAACSFAAAVTFNSTLVGVVGRHPGRWR